MTGAVTVYTTCGSQEDAERLVRALVDEKLIACGNIFSDATSIYRWEGRVATETEAVVLMKTTTARVPELKTRIRELHSYATPAITVWPIVDVEPGYLKWIELETRD